MPPPMSVSAGTNVFNVTGVATLPARMRLAAGFKDQLMDRLEEMLRLEKVRYAIERVVVDQDCTEKALLSLDIMRSGPIGGCAGIGGELHNVRIGRSHRDEVYFLSGECWASISHSRSAGRKRCAVLCTIHTSK